MASQVHAANPGKLLMGEGVSEVMIDLVRIQAVEFDAKLFGQRLQPIAVGHGFDGRVRGM